MPESNSKALVLFSGGQDSTTCLVWALHNYDYVETVGFNYGQRHAAELGCRTKILHRLRNEFAYLEEQLGQDHLLDFQTLYQISDTALTSDAEIKMTERGLPNTFVPGRNLLFFTLASAIAYRRGFSAVVGGMCETDFSGYPDCRRDVLNDLQAAVSGGMDYPVEFVTPLMYKTKAETWKLAFDLAGDVFVELLKSDTHTCYKGGRSILHAWGYGCGQCPACLIREAGYDQYIAASDSK